MHETSPHNARTRRLWSPVSLAVIFFLWLILQIGGLFSPGLLDDVDSIYIEIAREYQSVIVADVPILDSVRENQARRFIALVDELYDRSVNLIVSAAASPVDLYRGDRLTFPFERTASRLIEMQSEDYLAREHRP